MPIQKRDNLHHLIKSLTKNEKKFFRDFLKRDNGSKLYLLLFNKIDQQSKHQTAEIKKAFDKKANQLPVIRNYLSHLIGKVLNYYHHDNSTHDVICNNLLEVKRLLLREMYDLAEVKINKCLKLSKESELLYLEMNVLEMKKELLIRKYGPASELAKKDLTALIDEQNDLLKRLHNLQQLQHLQATFYDHFQESSGLSHVIYTDLDRNPLVMDEHQALSLSARILQADLQYRLHIYKNKNFPQADLAIQKAIRQLEISPQLVREQPETYLSLLNQRLQLLIYQKNLPEIQEQLAKIRQASQTYQFDLKQPALRRPVMEAMALELSICKQAGNREKATQLIGEITAQYKDLHSPAQRQWRAVMDYEIAKYYFDTGRLSEAFQKVREIEQGEYSLRESGVLLRSIFLRAQIALLQKNNLELNKVSTILKKFFINVKKATRLEKNLLHLLELWPSCSGSAKKFPRLKLAMEKVIKAAGSTTPAELEDLLEWLNEFMTTSRPSA